MATWTDELKAEVIKRYQDAEPTPENSMEIVTEITKDMELESPNGVRMILSQAGVYIKKDAAKKTTASAAASGDKPARVSKEGAQQRLVAAIEAAGQTADAEIVGKLTGKAAVHFAEIIEAINSAD